MFVATWPPRAGAAPTGGRSRMIAPAKPVRRPKLAAAWHTAFLIMLPRIRDQARFAFRKTRPEAQEDAIAEVVAAVCVAYARLVAQGKACVACPSALTRFAVQQFRSGRRLGCKLNVKDVSSVHCQLRKTHHPGPPGPSRSNYGWMERCLARGPPRGTRRDRCRTDRCPRMVPEHAASGPPDGAGPGRGRADQGRGQAVSGLAGPSESEAVGIPQQLGGFSRREGKGSRAIDVPRSSRILTSRSQPVADRPVTLRRWATGKDAFFGPASAGTPSFAFISDL